MKKFIILSIAVLLISAPLLSAQGKHLLGGRCSYNKTQGTCQIVSVSKTEKTIAQKGTGGGPGYEGYLIKFIFYFGEEPTISESEKEHTLRLTNSWYPGEKFLEKYDIKEGKLFKCEKWEIIKGTCAPIVFKFPNIDTSDYFESKRNAK